MLQLIPVTEQPTADGRSRRFAKFCAVFAIAVLFHGLLLPMVETGGDAAEAWLFVKKLSWGLPIADREWNHRTVRFGILGPAYATQAFLGTSAWVYYVAPLTMCGLSSALLFRLADRRMSQTAAWAVTAAFCLFPQIHTVATQLKPEIFSLVYILASANAIVSFGDTRKTRYLIAGGIWLFVAYGTKAPNLFYVPGLLALLFAEGGRGKAALVFGGVALALGGLENAAHVTAGQTYGRIGYMMAKHFTSPTLAPMGVLGLFERYTQLTGAWAWLLGLTVLATVGLLVRRKDLGRFERAIVVFPLVFFVITTFAVKSIDPIAPAQPFRDRYLSSAIPWMLLTIALAARHLGPELSGRVRARGPWLVAGIGGLLVIVQIALNPVSLGDHPLRLFPRYQAQFSEAFRSGAPVYEAGPGHNSLRVTRSLFWSPTLNQNDEGEHAVAPRMRRSKKVPGYWYMVDESRWSAHPRPTRRKIIRRWRGTDQLEVYRVLEIADGKVTADLFRMRVRAVPQR